jgi:hypothetical protein
MKRVTKFVSALLVGAFLLSACSKENIIPIKKDNKHGGSHTNNQNAQGAGG